MRRRAMKWLAVGLCALLWAVPSALSANGLEEQIEMAIEDGVAWLAAQQNENGSWPYGWDFCDSVGYTGLAVLKLEDYALDQGMNPLDEGFQYSTEVQKGLDFIAAQAGSHAEGYYISPCGSMDHHVIYSTSVGAMALAASQNPTYAPFGTSLYDLVAGVVDFLAWAQADEACGSHRGGWRYYPDTVYCDSDNSNSGYVTLALGYAEAAPPFGFGIEVPQLVKDELSIWIDVIQDDVNGDPDDGGSWYTPSWEWVNILKTGNLLYEMGLVGDTDATPRVQDALDYIERHWTDAGGCGTGWLNHRQAMFTMMKGLEALGIETLVIDDNLEYDWFADVAQHLIDTQQPAGNWPDDCWGDEVLSTAWALLTLEKAVPTFEIQVAVDIKPSSCPNPLNVGKKGVVPVAIVGTADFDVYQIDPATVALEGVAPLRWAFDDVATPYEPFLGKQGAYDCHELSYDGYMDLTLKFGAQELVAALGDVSDGDVLVLTLTGNLKEEFGGTPIVGEDVMLMIVK